MMICSNVRKCIYLFDELEEEERARVNRHIASCPACQGVYQRVRNEKDILKRALVTPPDNEISPRLTANIMAAINHEEDERPSLFILAVGYLLSKPIRYALATLSLFLGLFFFTEYNQPVRSIAVKVQTKQRVAGVALNSAMFYKEFNRMRQSGITTKALSIYQCLHACQHSSADECFACKTKFAKLNKQYESI